MNLKAKWLAALLTTGAICGTIAAAPKSALLQIQVASAANTYNYVEAMQKSLFSTRCSSPALWRTGMRFPGVRTV